MKKNFLNFPKIKQHFLHFNVCIRFKMVKFHLIWINCIWKHISFCKLDLRPASSISYKLPKIFNKLYSYLRLFCSMYFRFTSHSFQDCVINNPKNYAADFSIFMIFFVFFAIECCTIILLRQRFVFVCLERWTRFCTEKIPLSSSFDCTNFQWLELNWLSIVAIVVIDVMKQLLLLIFHIEFEQHLQLKRQKKRNEKWIAFFLL